jgi:catechol 2,3-dioxygenase-like lactoylglutathione lyase family enzyme
MGVESRENKPIGDTRYRLVLSTPYSPLPIPHSPLLLMHHASIRTANIHKAIAFYENLGFTVMERFTTGYTLACWMEGLNGRIELIQIPEPKPAPDAFADEHYVGYYHLSFDLTSFTPDLPSWLESLKERFVQNQNDQDGLSHLKVLLEPTQQQIGNRIYEVAFIADADGLPLEFIRVLAQL